MFYQYIQTFLKSFDKKWLLNQITSCSENRIGLWFVSLLNCWVLFWKDKLNNEFVIYILRCTGGPDFLFWILWISLKSLTYYYFYQMNILTIFVSKKSKITLSIPHNFWNISLPETRLEYVLSSKKLVLCTLPLVTMGDSSSSSSRTFSRSSGSFKLFVYIWVISSGLHFMSFISNDWIGSMSSTLRMDSGSSSYSWRLLDRSEYLSENSSSDCIEILCRKDLLNI